MRPARRGLFNFGTGGNRSCVFATILEAAKAELELVPLADNGTCSPSAILWFKSLIARIPRENASLPAVMIRLPRIRANHLGLHGRFRGGVRHPDTAFLTMNQVRMAFMIRPRGERNSGWIPRRRRRSLGSILGRAFGFRRCFFFFFFFCLRRMGGKFPTGGRVFVGRKAGIDYAGSLAYSGPVDGTTYISPGLFRSDPGMNAKSRVCGSLWKRARNCFGMLTRLAGPRLAVRWLPGAGSALRCDGGSAVSSADEAATRGKTGGPRLPEEANSVRK